MKKLKRIVRVPARKASSQAVAVVEARRPLSDDGADEVAMLLHAITDPKCDVAKAERIEAMIERARAKRAEAAFNAAFIDLQADLPEINKDGQIVIEGRSGKRGQNTAYATYPNVQRATRPHLHKHRFTLKHTVEPGKDGIGIVVRSVLSHANHDMVCVLPVPLEDSGSKNKVQGINSSISYGKRIGTTTLLDLISRAKEDADLDGHTAERVVRKAPLNQSEAQGVAPAPGESPAETTVEVVEEVEAVMGIDMEQAQKLSAAIADCGVPLHLFEAKYGRAATLPAARFSEAMQACADYKRRMGDSQKMAATG